MSGDNAQVKINYTGSAPPEGECTQKAWAVVKNAMGAVIQPSSAPIPLGTDVQTSGTLQGTPSGTFTWPTSGSVTDIKGTVTCAGGGKEANSKDETCTLTVKSAIYEMGLGVEISLPTEETVVKVTIPTSNWEYSGAEVTCNVDHLASGSCSVAVASATSGCGVSSATLTGQNYLGRESIGNPTCETFNIKVTPTSNCKNMKCTIEQER